MTEKRIQSAGMTKAELDSNLDGIRLSAEFADLPSVIKSAINKKRLSYLLGEGLEAFKPPEKIMQFIMAVTYRRVDEDNAKLTTGEE